MSQLVLLPRNPWAQKLEERAFRFARNQMHHYNIDAGHYLYALTTAEAYEQPARRFVDRTSFGPGFVKPVVKRSLPRDASRMMVVEPYTEAGVRMMGIATVIAKERQSQHPVRGGAQIIQSDLIVGILFSGSESVDELLGKAGIQPDALLCQLNIPIPAIVREMIESA